MIIGLLFIRVPAADAAEFRTDYVADYYLTDNGSSIGTQVSLKIKVTNLTTDLIIKKFSLQFPKSFQIGNIKANDDYKEIVPSVTEEEGRHVIATEFSNPQAGLNTQNSLYLNFIQYNLFKINGNVWEVILPIIDNREGSGDYTVNVHLPAGTRKKISIAKPKPDYITVNDIMWKNPSNRTIYAVFGEEQNYALDLRYTLENPNVTRVYTDIAFPPDTQYQKTFVNSIQPPPASVTVDDDGNYIGRYFLNPKENKTVYFKGGVVVYAVPRPEMRVPVQEQFSRSKKYLLSTSKDWTLLSKQIPYDAKTVRQIYDYTTSTLTYNYDRINTNVTRLGASQALTYPDQAVCTEYSDVFISLGRENGIFAREIQGFGFSNDQNFRPLSVHSDILHSWPEYYDTSVDQWHPLDPTWEDTSGIDYFNSFDLNHIAFAIHGKDPEYPYPAGSYKTDDAMKDINISATADVFQEKKDLSFEVSPIQIPGFSSNTYTMKVFVKNSGNTFVWNYPLAIIGEGLTFTNPSTKVSVIAPYSTKELSFEYVPSKFTGSSLIKLVSNGQPVFEKQVPITSSYFAILKIGLFVISGLIICFFIYKLIKRW